MGSLFLKIVNMSIAASWLILAVILLRILLKKAPKWINVLLWGAVAIRLLCPITIESNLSMVPSAEVLPNEVISGPSFDVNTGFNTVDAQINDYLGDRYFEGVTVPANNGANITTILSVVWIVGILAFAVFAFVSYLKIRNKVRPSLNVRDNIWICDDIQTPFILGCFKPRIYIPSGTDEAQLSHIIAHENAHLKRRDHWWKPLGFMVLAVHWFNPLVWVAYILLCRDIELACDEKVIRELSQNESVAYSEALLSCSVNRRMVMVCPLAFGEVGVKERVKRVLNYRKPAFWIVAVAVIVSIVVAICFLTNPRVFGDSITLIEQSTPVRGNAFTYDVSFGQSVMSGTVHAEQWSNGTCVKSSPVVLTNEVDEINILINVRRENNSSVGVDIQVDTNEYGGSLITYFAFPDNQSIIGWGCKGYELNEPVQIQPETEKILAAMVFDVGNGVRAFGMEDLIINPERLENADYAIVIRASFDSTNLGNENNKTTPIYSSFNATVLEIHDGYYLVEPVEGSWELSSADQIEVPIRSAYPSPEPEVGDVIEIEYSGEILETYPARIADVYGIKVVEESDVTENDLLKAFYRSKEYDETVSVTDYVYVDDGAYGLEGVIQYENETGTPWKLAFIRDGVSFPVSMDFGTEYKIASELTYLGNGVVRVYVENLNDGTFNMCKMEYSYDEAEKQTNFKASTEEYRRLTVDEIDQINEAFSPIVFDKQGNPIGTNPWACFFTSYYDNVREMDFEEFLAYFTGDGSTVSEEEFAALKELDNFLFRGEVDTLSDMPVPVHRYPRRLVDMVLKEYAGIMTEDLDTSGVEYLSEYDAYYNYTSDFGPGTFTCTRGEIVDDIVRLYDEKSPSGTDILTLQKDGENYRIVSHQHIEA